MRATLTLATALLLAVTAGCAAPRGHAAEHVVCVAPAEPRAELASALLFDPVPGRYPPSAFAFRSDWPSTTAYYSPGQVIFFSEHFHDFQGRGFDPDWTYRRFDAHRFGVGYR